ncbi:MAG: hypothetical protein R6V35_02805 [Candidatus Nanohaloarchaea archaeon]
MVKVKSQLGDVTIEEDCFYRKKQGEWENILDQYPDEKIIDGAEFSEITGLKLEEGSVNPCIKVQIDDEEWKHLFFQVNDPVQKAWARLRYMWQSYLQNHSGEDFRN